MGRIDSAELPLFGLTAKQPHSRQHAQDRERSQEQEAQEFEYGWLGLSTRHGRNCIERGVRSSMHAWCCIVRLRITL